MPRAEPGAGGPEVFGWARRSRTGEGRVSPQPFDSLKVRRHLPPDLRQPITQQYPEYKRPVYPRFRGRHRLWKHENGLEKCVGCSLCAAACPADCIGSWRRRTRRATASRRAALRAHLRDQPQPLHLLRVLRGSPARSTRSRSERVRDRRILARRPDLHEGHAPRGADQASAGRRSRPYPQPAYKTSSWVGWKHHRGSGRETNAFEILSDRIRASGFRSAELAGETSSSGPCGSSQPGRASAAGSPS